MSKHTPWTGEDAVKAAALYVNRHTESGIRKIEERAFLKAVEWAAAQIEKCETIHGGGNMSGAGGGEVKIFAISVTVFLGSIICLLIYDEYQKTKTVCDVVAEVGGCQRGTCKVRLLSGRIDYLYLPLVGEEHCWTEKP